VFLDDSLNAYPDDKQWSVLAHVQRIDAATVEDGARGRHPWRPSPGRYSDPSVPRPAPSGLMVRPRGGSYVQPRPMLAQPFFPLAVVRHHLVDLVPERVGVVAVTEVAEFVGDDVVDDGLRSQHALPMEGDVA